MRGVDVAKVFDVMKHDLVPRHELLTDAEMRTVLEKYNVNVEKLPKILSSDPVARAMRARAGQIIKIKRKSQTAGVAIAYRYVIEG